MKAKKHLGQNFLSDKNILEEIIDFSGVVSGDTVLEIGPGTGALTERLLARGASVRAIELDQDLIPVLQKRFSGDKNFSLFEGDILNVPLKDLLSGSDSFKVVANIPYYITGRIIRRLLSQKPAATSITLLVQKEVAERLSGDEKERSILTVATHFYTEVSLGPIIKKEYFDPVPKVDSQVVFLKPRVPFPAEDSFFFQVVRSGFAARRKTLFNNLLSGRLADKETLEALFQKSGWSLKRRAQELEVWEWQKIAEGLSQIQKSEKEKNKA